jgi:hypothetical protein
LRDQTIPRGKAEILAEAIRAGSAKAPSSTGTSSANPGAAAELFRTLQARRNAYPPIRKQALRGEKIDFHGRRVLCGHIHHSLIKRQKLCWDALHQFFS